MSCRRLLGRGRGEDSVGMAGTVLQGAPLHNTQSWVSLAMSQPLNTPPATFCHHNLLGAKWEQAPWEQQSPCSMAGNTCADLHPF